MSTKLVTSTTSSFTFAVFESSSPGPTSVFLNPTALSFVDDICSKALSVFEHFCFTHFRSSLYPIFANYISCLMNETNPPLSSINHEFDRICGYMLVVFADSFFYIGQMYRANPVQFISFISSIAMNLYNPIELELFHDGKNYVVDYERLHNCELNKKKQRKLPRNLRFDTIQEAADMWFLQITASLKVLGAIVSSCVHDFSTIVYDTPFKNCIGEAVDILRIDFNVKFQKNTKINFYFINRVLPRMRFTDRDFVISIRHQLFDVSSDCRAISHSHMMQRLLNFEFHQNSVADFQFLHKFLASAFNKLDDGSMANSELKFRRSIHFIESSVINTLIRTLDRRYPPKKKTDISVIEDLWNYLERAHCYIYNYMELIQKMKVKCRKRKYNSRKENPFWFAASVAANAEENALKTSNCSNSSDLDLNEAETKEFVEMTRSMPFARERDRSVRLRTLIDFVELLCKYGDQLNITSVNILYICCWWKNMRMWYDDVKHSDIADVFRFEDTAPEEAHRCELFIRCTSFKLMEVVNLVELERYSIHARMKLCFALSTVLIDVNTARKRSHVK